MGLLVHSKSFGLQLSVACAVLAAPQPANEAPKHLLEKLQERGRQTFEISYTSTKSCMLSASELADRVRRFGALPDHPQRGRLDYLQQLATAPEVKTVEIVWAGEIGVGARCWRMTEHRSPVHPAASRELIVAGDQNDRWMLSRAPQTGQLTVIRAGVPFPAAYNIGRFAEIASDYVSLLVAGGLGLLSRNSTEASMEQSTPESWQYTFDDQEHDLKMVVVGRAMENEVGGLPVEISEFRPRASFAAGRASRVIRLSGFAAIDALGGATATRIQIDDADGVREELSIQDVRSISQVDASLASKVPAAGSDVRLVDFRDSRSPAWTAYAQSPRMTWTTGPGGESYSLSNTALPFAAPASGVAGRFSIPRRIAMVGVPAVLLGAVMLRIYFKRRFA